jgi:hypothetical protein
MIQRCTWAARARWTWKAGSRPGSGPCIVRVPGATTTQEGRRHERAGARVRRAQQQQGRARGHVLPHGPARSASIGTTDTPTATSSYSTRTYVLTDPSLSSLIWLVRSSAEQEKARRAPLINMKELDGSDLNKKNTFAPAGNRTRVCTVAGYYSTTRPLVPCGIISRYNL